MNRSAAVVLVGLFGMLGLGGCARTVSVTTPVGEILGLEEGTYQEFLGIPYALPPVGQRRWALPEPPKPFVKLYDATRFRPACPQPLGLSTVIVQDENCLYLNIWRPAEASGALPVMVFIHGGMFASGAGSESQYHGDELAAKNGVVVVTLNYRLGPLGFLALPELTAEAGSSGNYGFYDQNMALRWVHDNIAAFGGDPSRILLFGQSAGAFSTCFHLASGLSRRLFNSAVLESGNCSVKADSQDAADAKGLAFADALGCQTDRLTCLRGKSAQELIAGAGGVDLGGTATAFPRDFSTSLVLDNRFMTEQPMTALASGAASGKTVVIGDNHDEGTLFAAFGPPIDTESEYESVLAQSLAEPIAAGAVSLDQVLSVYPMTDYPSGANAIADVMGDQTFVCRALQTANALVGGGASVYFYYFTQDVQAPLELIVELTSTANITMGTFHASEIPYVFGVPSILGNLDGPRAATSEMVRRYWTRVAAYGSPNGPGTPFWPNYLGDGGEYLVVNQDPTTASGLKAAACALWQRL